MERQVPNELIVLVLFATTLKTEKRGKMRVKKLVNQRSVSLLWLLYLRS